MSRLSYKFLYIREKAIRETYESMFNNLLKKLKDFDIKVIDKKVESTINFGYDRHIEIGEGEKKGTIIYSYILEEEIEEYLKNKREGK